MSKQPKRRARRDIAIVHGPTEDGQGARILRFRDDGVSAGEIRPAREGEPTLGRELLRLRPLHRKYPVCEVEVLQPGAGDETAPTRTGEGPARVSNERYRRNWGAVFKPERKRGRDDGWSVN